VRLSHRLEDLRAKRIELEANRNQVVRQMQQLQTQITIQRREGGDFLTFFYYLISLFQRKRSMETKISHRKKSNNSMRRTKSNAFGTLILFNYKYSSYSARKIQLIFILNLNKLNFV
jgi:hypothetical protein